MAHRRNADPLKGPCTSARTFLAAGGAVSDPMKAWDEARASRKS